MMKRLSLALLLALVAAASAYDRVLVEVFSMSKCPDCEGFAETFTSDVLDAKGLPDVVQLIEYAVAKDDPSDPSGFSCLHGTVECWGDMLELCAHNLTGGGNATANNRWTWWHMTVCMYEDREHIPDNFESCAHKAGFSDKETQSIYQCAHGQLGHDLMEDSVKQTVARGIQWAPTVFINGEQQPTSGVDYLRKVCDAYTGPQPAGCRG